MSNEWLTADDARLKHLRMQANMEPTTLAYHFAISSTMLKQLEDGGDSAFYSKVIKFQTGRKLLKFFGEDVSNPETSATDVSATTLTLDKIEQIAKTVSEIIRVSEMSVAEPQRNAIVSEVMQILRNNRSLIVTLCLGAVLLIGAFEERTTLTQAATTLLVSKEETVDVQRSFSGLGAASSSAALIQESQSSAVSEASQATVNPERPISVKFQQDPKPSTTLCNWSDSITASTSPSPTKKGDYVFFIATKDVNLCVMDKSKVTKEFKLKANAERNVTGVPPFRIYSNDLKDVKVFYQGYRIMIRDSVELMLNEVQLSN